MRFMKYIIAGILAVLALTACSSTTSNNDKGQQQESAQQQKAFDQLHTNQKAHVMTYSPTLDTINAWIDTWNKPNQLAYVYLANANGDITDFYVFKHPPVSYCTAITPNYKILRYDGGTDGATNPVMVPAPGMDGAYYSGADCQRYYGQDATSGSLMEFTVGLGQNMKMFTQPIPPQNLQNATAWGKAAQEQK